MGRIFKDNDHDPTFDPNNSIWTFWLWNGSNNDIKQFLSKFVNGTNLDLSSDYDIMASRRKSTKEINDKQLL